jgi:hypothetical protein
VVRTRALEVVVTDIFWALAGVGLGGVVVIESLKWVYVTEGGMEDLMVVVVVVGFADLSE